MGIEQERAWAYFWAKVTGDGEMMAADVNNEILRAGEVMSRYRMSREDQITVVKILMDAGVEHCLQKQEALRAEREKLIQTACAGPGLVH